MKNFVKLVKRSETFAPLYYYDYKQRKVIKRKTTRTARQKMKQFTILEYMHG